MSKNAWDGTYCTVNPKFLAVVLDTSGAGGAFLVIPLEKVGHQKLDSPRVAGHQREILDIQWNPFNDHIIASASEDTTIKIWRIPSGGLTEDLLEPLVDLHGHQRKVGIIRWHPTANGVIASAAFDYKVIVWNALKAKSLCVVDGHHDTIFDLAFNYNGSLMATTSKDKKLRVIEAHTGRVLQTFGGHGSSKTSHVSFTDKIGDHLVTTGFSISGEREISLWDLNKPSSPVQTDAVDNSSSILMLHYDMDIKVAYIAGKGDGMIRYYEIRQEQPFLMRLSEYRHSSPQKSLGKMCKRGLDTSRCELFRFYKLHPNNWIEPLPMVCPRRSDEFQEDLYPPTPSIHPALTADEWITGMDKEPNLMSFKDGGHSNGTDGVMSPTTAASSAEKYNSLFNKPAKFEKQLSKEAMLSNDVNYHAGATSPTMISKTIAHEVQSVNNEELDKLKQLSSEQAREIEVLKRTISAKEERISKLERDLSSKNLELSEIRDQYSKKISGLSTRVQNGVSTVDGRTGRGDTIITKTSQTTVQSSPRRGPSKRLVEESITSSKKSPKVFEEHGIHQVLEEAHREPVRTGASYGRQTSVGDQSSARGQPPVGVQSPVGMQSPVGVQSPVGGQPPVGKQTPVSPSEEYRIEDIEAELESLREDLARTREVRHGGKSKVRYVNEDEGKPAASEGYSRTVYSENVSASDVASPRQRGYGVDSGVGSPSQGRDSDGKRMVITTASYARVPRHEANEPSYGRQTSSGSKEKKSYL